MHKLLRAPLWASVALVLLACGPTTRPPSAGWQAQAEAVAAGLNTAARRSAVSARLAALGIPWRDQVFGDGKYAGVNLIADLGGPADAPLLLLGAHVDRAEVGRGAVDNASGVALVLELGAALRAQPLANHRVLLAFWDLEELGLVGSGRWVATATETPALYVNFDVFGYGDTIWAMVPAGQAAFGDALTAAAGSAGVATRIGEAYPPSDHEAFLHAGKPAVSLSLIDGAEIPAVLEVFAGREPAVMPRIIRTIHSNADQPEQLEPAAVARALPVVLDALRRWDAARAR